MRRGRQRIVTISSALVGWIASVSSKSRLRAPIVSATAKPWIISSAPGPITWQPTIYSSAPTVTSFIAVCGFTSPSA